MTRKVRYGKAGDTSRWDQIRALFAQAQERSVEQWPSVLERAETIGEDVRHEVESLLEADREAGDFLEPVLPLERTLHDPRTVSVEGDRSSTWVGERLAGRYEVEERLGKGGMGVVFRARDHRLDRAVAVKMLKEDALSSRAENRLRREAKLVASMDHPSITPVYDVDRHGDMLFVVMPVVAGTTLRAALRAAWLQPEQVLEVAAQVADALDYSHRRGVVHRDIKPANIMVTRDGDTIRARVMDFGIAQALDEAGLTRTGRILGTLAYLSPEQIVSGSLDGRSDLYGLGTVLYECLAGRPPFRGIAHSLMYRIVNEPPRSLSSRGVEIDPALEHVVLQCLAKDADARPQRGRDLAISLRRLAPTLDRSVVTRAGGSTEYEAASTGSLIVGRDRELRELYRRLGRARAGRRQLALIGGAAGIGKTALIDEIVRVASDDGIRTLSGRFSTRDRSLPFQGWWELIEDGLRAWSPDDDDLGAVFGDLAMDLIERLPALSSHPVLERAASHGSWRGVERGERAVEPTEIFELVAKTLVRLSRREPLVLVLENLHVGDVSIDALEYIAHRLGSTPTLMLASYREDELARDHPLHGVRARMCDDPDVLDLRLEPLDRTAFEALLGRHLRGEPLHRELVVTLHEATEGNPLFVQELVSALLEGRGIRRDASGTWFLARVPGSWIDAMPATVEQAVARRLERLPSIERTVLSVAAVLGREFVVADLEHVARDALRDQADEVERSLDELMQAGYLNAPRRRRLRFQSGLVRDLLYERVPRRRRRAWHRAYAELIENRYVGRLEEVYPLLVHHFSEGEVAPETVGYARHAARAYLEALCPHDAERAALIGLELVEELDDDALRAEGELRALLAVARRDVGDLEGALQQAEQAAGCFVKQGGAEEVTGAWLQAAEVAWRLRRVDDVRQMVRRGIDAARACASPPSALSDLLALAATVAHLRGSHGEAQALLAEANDRRRAPSTVSAARGGTLVAAVTQPIRRLGPGALELDEHREIIGALYDTLLARDGAGNLVPALAVAWHEEGDRGYVLELRPEVAFSDGRPLDATAVKQALEHLGRSAGEPSPALALVVGFDRFRRGEAQDLVGLEPVDRLRLRVRLREPSPLFLSLLTVPSASIALPAGDGDATWPVGTGAFHVIEHDARTLRLARSPRGWRPRPARLDELIFRRYVDAFEIAADLRAGGVDLARDLLPEDLESILSDVQLRHRLVEASRVGTFFALIHPRGPAAHRDALRRALIESVPVQALVWQTLGRFAQPAVGLVPPTVIGHDPGRRTRLCSVSSARQLLASSGLETPIRLQALIHPQLQERYGALTASLLDAWAEIGVEVAFELCSLEDFWRRCEEPEGLDLLLTRWRVPYDDPDAFTHALFHQRHGRLRHWFASADADRLLERARTMRDVETRVRLYRRFQHLLDESDVLLPLFHEVDYRIAGPLLSDVTLSSRPPYLDYAAIGKAEAVAAKPTALGTSDVALAVAVPTSVIGLDPAAPHEAEDYEPVACVFETLTRIEDGAVAVPWLARSIETLAGGRLLRVRLRDGLRFHDGRRLTARDVRASFERLLRSDEADRAALLAPVRGAPAVRGGALELSGLRILSELELEIELDDPMPSFVAVLAHPALSIVPEGESHFARSWRGGCVGTGPYRVVRQSVGARIELEAWAQYWGRPPEIERLVFHTGVSAARELRDFRAGRLSLAGALTPESVATLRAATDPALPFSDGPRLSTFFLAFNRHRPPFDRLAVRQTVVQALEAEALQASRGGTMTAATGLLPPELVEGEPPGQPVLRRSTPEVLVGRRLRALVHPAVLRLHGGLWDELTARLGAFGATLEYDVARVRDPSVLRDARDVDLVCQRWVADYPDADSFASGLLAADGGAIGALVGEERLDALIARGRSEADPALRRAAIRELELHLAEQALLVPLFHEQSYRFLQPSLSGLRLGLTAPQVRYEQLHPRSAAP